MDICGTFINISDPIIDIGGTIIIYQKYYKKSGEVF